MWIVSFTDENVEEKWSEFSKKAFEVYGIAECGSRSGVVEDAPHLSLFAGMERGGELGEVFVGIG
jgi:hypothetical protein